MNDIWRLLRMCAGNTVVPPTEPPGSVWTARNPPAAYSGNSTVWSPELNLFVIVGTPANKVATSPDGINWTIRTVPYDGQTSWQGVTWSKELNLFAAVGNQTSSSATATAVMTSPDGINWTHRVASLKGNWADIAWSPALGLFVAGRFASSFDGLPILMTSPDGINWTSRAYTGPSMNNGISTVAWSPDLNLFVAAGRNGYFATSSDGITWQSQSFPSASMQSLFWSDTYGLFYGFSGANFYYSTNGFTWVPSTNVGTATINRATTDTGYNLLTVVKNGSGAGVAWKSEDGMTWSTTGTGVMPNTSFWQDMTYSPSLNRAVCVSSASPYIATSPD